MKNILLIGFVAVVLSACSNADYANPTDEEVRTSLPVRSCASGDVVARDALSGRYMVLRPFHDTFSLGYFKGWIADGVTPDEFCADKKVV